MNIKFYHRHTGISYLNVMEIINTYDEKETWQEGQIKVLSKYMREIYFSSCVKLDRTNKDKTYFAFRGDKKYLSKMLNTSIFSIEELDELVSHQRTHWCTAVIKKISEEEYFVITAFWGTPAPKEPGNFSKEERFGKEYKESLEFWKNHALIPEKGEKLTPYDGEDIY